MKIVLMKVISVCTFLIASISNAFSQQAISPNTSSDNAGGTDNTQTVNVAGRVWAAKNLDVALFANGDSIPEAKTPHEWMDAGENQRPAWCYFNNDPANGAIYGKLYNWYAVHDPRGLAPKGWHVPSDKEWDVLIKEFAGPMTQVNKPFTTGGVTYYFTKDAGNPLKSTTGWKKSNGTNKSGMAFPGGGNRLTDGSFDYLGEYGSWWSSTEESVGFAWYRGLYFGNGKVNRVGFAKNSGFSVRCIKDL